MQELTTRNQIMNTELKERELLEKSEQTKESRTEEFINKTFQRAIGTLVSFSTDEFFKVLS